MSAKQGASAELLINPRRGLCSIKYLVSYILHIPSSRDCSIFSSSRWSTAKTHETKMRDRNGRGVEMHLAKFVVNKWLCNARLRVLVRKKKKRNFKLEYILFNETKLGYSSWARNSRYLHSNCASYYSDVEEDNCGELRGNKGFTLGLKEYNLTLLRVLYSLRIIIYFQLDNYTINSRVIGLEYNLILSLSG